jgi:type 1 glutamine amidotransferase
MGQVMRITRFLLSIGLCVVGSLAVAGDAGAQQEGAKKKVVFVAGKRSHGPGEHEHRAGCMLLAEHLNKSGLAIEAVVTFDGWPEDQSIFDGASAVVIYSDGGGGHPAMRNLTKLKELADKGVGIGAIHYAVEVPKGPGGDLFLDVIGGYFETNWSVNPHWDASFKIPEHAVTRGIKDFQIRDEWYYHMRFPADMKGVTPILSALPPADSLRRPDGAHSGNPEVRAAVLERKELQHLMWLFERPQDAGAGRGFGFTGGHFHKNWQDDNHRRVVLNAVAWIAKLEVPKDGVPSKTPSAEEMQANLDKK